MTREKKILKNYFLYFSTLLLTCIIGISNIFADTTIDTSTWVNVTGRNWSITGQEFYSGTQTFNNDVLLNHYNVTGGVYTPPNQFDYITYSFFEHNTSPFNPCNSTSKFTSTFKLLFTTPSFVNYVDSVKWGNENCSISNKNTTTGWIDVSCIASPSTGNYTDIFVNYTTISGTATSDLYITRNIDIACGLNTDAIIDNDNANTQNIINNNNTNTQNIIDSNNQNTQDIINSNLVCSKKTISYSDIENNNVYLNISGVLVSNQNYGVTSFFDISYTQKINVLEEQSSGSVAYCFYDDDETLISCSYLPATKTDITPPSSAKYFRSSINKNTNKPIYQIEFCKNGNQALDDSINNLDDTLNDDSVDDNNIAESFEDFEDYLDDNSTITQLITLPITLYTAILNNLNGTCSPFNLGSLYGEDLILPCINISQYLGSSLWTMIDIIISGFAIYAIAKKMIKVFNSFSSLREGDVIDD